MFWALASGEIDTRDFEFEHVLKDIQTLNLWALDGRLEVTALSLHAYPFVQEEYVLLPHGASMGSGYGPVVVTREPLSREELRDVEIAVPGRMTTAFLVLRMYLGDFRYREVPFDEILEEVSSGAAPAGLLIHEGQLTYGDAGPFGGLVGERFQGGLGRGGRAGRAGVSAWGGGDGRLQGAGWGRLRRVVTLAA